MNRRGFLGTALGLAGLGGAAGVAGAAASPAGPGPGAIQGVGVLRCPTLSGEDQERLRQTARLLAENIRAGGCIVLPNTRGRDGEYEWDFRIEGGDPAQVRVERGGG